MLLALMLAWTWRRRGVAALLLGASTAACSTEHQPVEPPVPAPASSPAARTLQRARTLATADAWLTSVLSARGGFRQSGGRFTSQAQVSRIDRTAAELPERADSVVALRAGSRTRPLVRIRDVHARSEPGQLVDGHVVYSSSLPGVDTIWSLHGESLEQQLLIHTAERRRFAWQLELRSDVERVMRERSGALLFVDASGDGLLRVAAPVLVDAAGARHALHATWQTSRKKPLSGRLAIDVDPSKLVLPVLLDPVFEVVTWQKLADSGPPAARYGHTLAFHPSSGSFVMFSGSNDQSDTWLFDLAQKAWSEPNPKPAQSPLPRTFHAMAADASGATLVLFGGRGANGSTLYDDTWVWNGAEWSNATSLVSNPSAREAHTLTNDATGKIVMHGGAIPAGKTDWTLLGWMGSQWTEISSLGPARNSATFVYDSANKRSVLFGGCAGPAFPLPTVFDWNGATWTEHQLPTSPVPAARSHHAAAYDSVNGTMVVFGGLIDGGQACHLAPPGDETWEWDGSAQTWHQVVPKEKPEKRSDSAMAYDPGHDRIVLFGGLLQTGLENKTFADTWQYRRLGNACTTSAECEGFECVDGVCCSEDACALCLRCATGSGKCVPVPSGSTDEGCTGAETCDGSGNCKKALGESCTSGGECTSGHCADGSCCTSSCSGACEACDLEPSKGTCSLVTGEPRHGSCAGSGPCASACTGNSPDCAFPPPGTECGSICTGSTLTLSVCDGTGACNESTPASCPSGLACADGVHCKSSCATASDCAPGGVCNDGACYLPATCAEECAPYRCVDGQCSKSCSTAADCVDGAVCTAERRCQADGAEPSDEGCGCRAAGSRGAPVGGALWALALAALRRRNARRRPASRSAARCR